ncbi:phytoene dehydrogenase-like oxidoreductase [Mycobacteroides abscessus subsp. abscessus]|uniref:phytoene desaturase family protein n=1 Tax=Mycobacteroides abscessus TaxID=36809 RepID=UPI00092877D4|nr:NAD(P)/FAD-dependent oxidoreductase [Mycobacteroides abscessus]SIL80715.1 phytoene dehydrogenase-like oxidoreductase [Mycobacteroides abscessus subsp. abscessus]SLF08260.1 phytoene dehydrogenase-like oxidoreductase [Mycobacteroides abscessus subsp. abscessus]
MMIGSGRRIDYDLVVIGAGLGGLTAAAYLAALGRNVLMLEKYRVLGGSSHVFRRRGQWEFEVGVHYIEDCGPGGMIPTVLAGLGLSGSVDFRQLDQNGFDTTIGPDLELRTPVGWDTYRDNLIDAFPRERKAIGRYLKLAQPTVSAADRMHPDFGSARRIAQAGTAAPVFMLPYAAVLGMCGFSARAIIALSVQAGAYASTPDRSPFGMHTGYIGTGIERGAWFPLGGGQTLSAVLYAHARNHGAMVRTDSTVDQIVVKAGHVQGVRLADGEMIQAPVVISNADIKRTFLELVGSRDLPMRSVVRARTWSMSLPFINTYFGLNRDLRNAVNTNYYVIPSWDRVPNKRSLPGFVSSLLYRAGPAVRDQWLDDYSANMPAFIHSGTIRDPNNPRTAPMGCSSVEAMTLVPGNRRLWGITSCPQDHSYRDSGIYQDIKSRLTDAMLDRVSIAFPGARSDVLWSEAATPATQERYVGNTDGAPFGLAVTPTQYGPMRPGVATPIHGLLCVGTSNRWGPGTTGAMISGVHAAGAVIGRDLMQQVRAGVVHGDAAKVPMKGQSWDPLAACKPSRQAAVGNR